MDANKPTVKAVKLIQAYLANPNLCEAEKLQKSIKQANKSEFLRSLAAIQSRQKLEAIMEQYQQKFHVSLEDEVKQNFPDDVSRVIVKMLSYSGSEEDEW